MSKPLLCLSTIIIYSLPYLLNFEYLVVSDLGGLLNFSFFEGFLPFKMSSPSFFYKIFFSMLVTIYSYIIRKLPLSLNYWYLVLFLYLENILGFFEIGWVVNLTNFNSLLANNINSVHPPLLYISFTYSLAFCFLIILRKYSVFFLKSVLSNLNPLLISLIPTASLFLGMWWAQIEGTWGGWWAWDPSENLILFSLFFPLLNFHTIVGYYKPNVQNYIIFLAAGTVIFYTLTQLGLVSTSHTFISTNSNKSLMYFAFFYFSCFLLIRLYKNYRVELPYSFNELSLKSVIYLGLLFFLFIVDFFGINWFFIYLVPLFFLVTVLLLPSSFFGVIFYRIIFLIKFWLLEVGFLFKLLHFTILITLGLFFLVNVFSYFYQDLGFFTTSLGFTLQDTRVFSDLGLSPLGEFVKDSSSYNVLCFGDYWEISSGHLKNYTRFSFYLSSGLPVLSLLFWLITTLTYLTVGTRTTFYV